MAKNRDKIVNRDTPSREEPGEPTIVPSQCQNVCLWAGYVEA